MTQPETPAVAAALTAYTEISVTPAAETAESEELTSKIAGK